MTKQPEQRGKMTYAEIVVEAKQLVEKRNELLDKVSPVEDALGKLAIEVRDHYGDQKLPKFAYEIARDENTHSFILGFLPIEY
jgi:hypothetical protein